MKRVKECSGILLLLIALLMMCFVSCGKSSDNKQMSGESPSKPGDEGAPGIVFDPETGVAQNRKIIKTYRISAETKEFDTALNTLNDLLVQNGGYMERSTVSDRSMNAENSPRTAEFVIRVPAENADTLISAASGILHVTSSSSDVDDISETYYSVEARLDELITERDSLLKMMEKIDTAADYNFWLTLETRLSQIRQEIAVYQGQINRYDDQVAYSTVNLHVREVLVYDRTDNFGTRLVNSFQTGWKNFGNGCMNFSIWLAGALPTLLLLAAIATVIILIARKAHAKTVEKNRKRMEQLQKRADIPYTAQNTSEEKHDEK